MATLPNAFVDTLENLIEPVVILGVSAEEAITSTLAKLRGHRFVEDLDALTQQVLAREARSSTAAEDGVAFPHARTTAVRQPVLAVGLSEQGVTFSNGELVHLILCMAVPPAETAAYLQMLAHLVRRVRQHGLAAFVAAREAAHLRALLLD